jgi:hypothetical protein
MAVVETRFDLAREQVVAMTLAGEPLSRIEKIIDREPLAADERDALWLLAWALMQRSPDRPAYLSAVSSN